MMKALLGSKPLMGLMALLLIVQLACVASSISPTATPGAAGGSSSTSTQPVSTQPSSGSQATQPVPLTGGQATQAMPATSAASQAALPNAQAVLNAVAQHYQAAGRQQALKDFTDRTAPFDTPGLFVMCLGSDHKITAMGGFPLLVGVSADSLNILNGQSLGNLIWDAASLDPQGQIPFQWKNPLTNQTESKTLFYQKLSQDVCGVVADQP